jgi:hypothetical protein
MRLLFIFTFSIMTVRCGYAQGTNFNLYDIANRLVQNIDKSDQDEILLNTDRKIYVAGEEVYFKAYLIDSIHHYLQTSPLKLYVDIVDDKDQVIQQLTLNSSALKTSGSFLLPDYLKEGYYWLRAYTRQMAMHDVGKIAVVPVFVVNIPFNKNYSYRNNTPITRNNPVVEVFPEGGTTISGLSSTVAVKVMNEQGFPMQISGIVKNSRDSVVTKFTTNQYGLAKFSYEPLWFLKYKILLQEGNVYDSVAAIPQTNFFSGQLAITKLDTDYVIARVALEDSIYSQDFNTYLLAVSGDSICFASVGKGIYNVNIPLAKFPPGMATLYLFDSKEKLLSTRCLYINKENYHLQVSSDRTNYAPREKVKLAFDVTDAKNQPEMGILNLSVIDKSTGDTDFNFSKPDTLQYLSQNDADLIMLAQRKKNNPLNYTVAESWSKDEDQGFAIKGQVLNAKDDPVPECVMTILANKREQIVEQDTTDENGNFKFELPLFNGKIYFTYQLSSLRGNRIDKYHAIFDTASTVQFATPSYLKTIFPLNDLFQHSKFQFTSSDSANLLADKHLLEPVTVKKSNGDNFDVNKRISRYSHVITRNMIGEGPGGLEYTLLNVPGVRLVGGYLIIISRDPSGVSPNDEPLLVIDGVQIEHLPTSTVETSPVLSYLNSLPLATIDSIEVLTGPEASVYGMNGGRGVIAITTGVYGGNNLQSIPALKSFVTSGFYIDQPFAIPDYSTRQVRNSKSRDERKTIYWNSNIVTDKNGKASVEFYSADPSATYMGIINGITTKGDKIYQTFTLERK